MVDKKIQILSITVIYLLTLFIWTLPIQQGKIPYGEVDGVSHFELADYMSLTDKVIVTLPDYINYRYFSDNHFKQSTLWYHPPYHVDLSMMQVFGGRYLPFYLLITIFCSLIVVIMFYIISKLYGFWVGILTSFLLAFSGRDYLVFLWGQWPERLGYFFTPIVLYVFYKYITSVLDKKENKNYAYLLGALLGINLMIHPMGFFHSCAALFICYIFFAIKEKKLFLFKLDRLIIPLVIFLVIAAVFPYQTGNVITRLKGDTSPSGDLSKLLYWFKSPESSTGTPMIYFSFAMMHGLWIIPFLLIGIGYLLFRRKNQDILLLGWLVSLYIILHADVFGKGPYVQRSLAASAHIFAPLTAIGLMAVISFLISIEGLKSYKTFIKYGLIGLFITLAIIFNAIPAYQILNNAGVTTLNPQQLDASDWLRANTKEDILIKDLGTLTLAQKRWIQGLSMRHVNDINDGRFEANFTNTHIMFDYSDLKVYGLNDQYNQMIKIEKTYFGNKTAIYNKGDIRIYELT